MSVPFLYRRTLVLAACVAVLAFPGISSAQRSSEASSQNDADAGLQIEEMIVTATRREADLRSVPLSVYMVTDEGLERLGALDFAEYARSVPGMSFTDFGLGGEKHIIRGTIPVSGFPPIFQIGIIFHQKGFR